MDTKQICPGCQKLLAPNAPQGLCPECLIKAGLGTGVDIGPDSQAQGGPTGFVAPTPEELAKPFPQLEMLSFIGQGGMGAVYKARQKSLDRVVALKILPPGIGKDPSFAQRFTREAKALAKLNHPGIVTLYEFGQADGLFYFLMEFVDGVNLRHLLEAGRVSPREALAIVPQICDALQYAHDQGIVHRDIKPENILLDRQGRVKVADFGLAKLVGPDALTPALSHPMGEGGGSAPVEGTPASAALTDAGKVMGTPQYMAPEQREHPTEVDHRADIYSLGVVFYQMLTGELPGKPIEAPSSRVRGMQIDVRLDEVVLRALEKEPAWRYQQVSEVRTAVETIAATPPAISSGRESAPTHSAGGLGSQHSVGAAPPPASQDRFWRRFALALAAVVLAPILILVGVALLGMILGVLSGARPQNQQSTHSVARSTNALPATVQTLTAPADLLPDPNDSSGQRQLRVLRQVVADGSDVATAGLAAVQSPNRVLEVRCEGPKAYIRAELDDLHEIHLFVGSDALGWSVQQAGSTSVTATVEASSQIKMEDGSMGRGLIFQARGTRHYIAITPGGPVPYGEVVFRPNSGITNENGTFTFADIRQTNGTLIPVSVRVRPVSARSPGSQSFGRVIETLIARAEAYDQGWGFFDLEMGKSFKPPFPLTFQPNQGPAFVELTPELKEWIKARGVDLLVHLGETNWDMMTLGMQEEFVGQLNEWETTSPEKIVGLFAKKDADHLVRDEVPGSSFGHSFRGTYGSVTAFRTRRNTMGVYQIQGMGNIKSRGVGIRYKAVLEAGERVQSTGGEPRSITPLTASGFGPAIERTVSSVFKDVSTCFLDLDAGGFSTPPTNLLAELRGMAERVAAPDGVLEAPGREVYGWLKQTGADLLGCDLEHGATLLFFGTTLVAVNNPALAFGEITPEQVASICRDLKNSWGEDKLFKRVPVLPLRFNEEPNRNANLIFFSTREGGMGVMEFVDFTNNPRGVKIRYKLLRQAGESAQSTGGEPRSRTFVLRHWLASEMANVLGQILLGRVGMEARPAPDNMQLTVTAPSDVLNRVSTFVAVTDWPKRIAQGKDYYYPREDAEQAGRSFFYACSIEDIEGVTRMLAPGVLAELKGTNLTAQGVGGEEKDEELVRQLRGNWEGKEAAVRRVVLAWNRFPLRTLQVEGKFSRSPGPRYFASAAFEGAPVEWVELSFVPDRSPKTKREPHFGPVGPLMMDTLPPWFGEKEAGLKASGPSPEKAPAGNSRASDTAAAQKLSFGPVTNGLQAAVELTASNGVVRLGEPIAVRFHIRNASDHPIIVAGSAYRQGDQCILEDEQGHRVEVSLSEREIITFTQRLLLGPGEVMVFESGGVSFQSGNEAKFSYLASYIAKAKPGRYTLRFRLHLPDAGPPDKPGPGDWQGDLETAPIVLDVNVPAPPAPAVKPATK